MSYERAVVTATNAGTTSYAVSFPLKSDCGLFQGFRLVTTGDTGVTAALSDKTGSIFFKDVADRDYTTAKDQGIVLNDVRTNLTGYTAAADATGAVITNIVGSTQAVVQSPITLTLTNTTAADTATLWFFYKSGVEKTRITLTSDGTSAAGIATLRTKFARLLGMKAQNVTDVASKLQIADKDGRILFLDAADRDYRTATNINQLSFLRDGTSTGLTTVELDSTGAAMGAAASGSTGLDVGRSPFTVTWTNAATLGDIMTIDLFYEV
jgi:hypothetical protein